jgi:hypothetical protein
MDSPAARHARPSRWLAPALLALGCAGCAAAWILLGVATGRQCSWMAVVAGIDAALLLRLAAMPRGPARMVVAMLGTAATIVLANWGIAATQLGRSIGVLPWASAIKLGPDHAWTVLSLANTSADLAWLAAGVVLAAVLSR